MAATPILLIRNYPMSSVDSDQKEASPPSTPPDPTSREYDTSGFYPAEGKPFRIWGLLFWNIVVIVIVAVASAVLNFVLL